MGVRRYGETCETTRFVGSRAKPLIRSLSQHYLSAHKPNRIIRILKRQFLPRLSTRFRCCTA